MPWWLHDLILIGTGAAISMVIGVAAVFVALLAGE